MKKTIITAAICGNEYMKEDHPAIPYTIPEIVREAKGACEAGAAVIHLHVRQDDGTPTQEKYRFKEAIHAILKVCPEVIIMPSTIGTGNMRISECLQPVELVPEIASLDCGARNYRCNEDHTEFEAVIRDLGNRMLADGVKPELECCDKGMVDTVMHLYKEGWLVDPLQFNFKLGIKGGMDATPENLLYLVQSIPGNSTWSACGIGPRQMDILAQAVLLGGNVRVGLEDNLRLPDGKLAKDNAQLVECAAALIRALGREAATPAEARSILGLGQRYRQPWIA